MLSRPSITGHFDDSNRATAPRRKHAPVKTAINIIAGKYHSSVNWNAPGMSGKKDAPTTHATVTAIAQSSTDVARCHDSCERLPSLVRHQVKNLYSIMPAANSIILVMGKI